jgi:ubiquinone/menaquinone biosynthesis C-methylase UbiE
LATADEPARAVTTNGRISAMHPYKKRQQEFEDSQFVNYALAKETPTLGQAYYNSYAFSHAAQVAKQAGLVDPESILVVCCGAGSELKIWLSEWPLRKLFILDFSVQALGAAQRRKELDALDGELIPICADAEALPCRDGAVDLVVITNGLHHLLDPVKGLNEMYRVARRGVIAIEPADTILMPFFKRVGLAKKYEEAGNEVRRLSRRAFEGVIRGSDTFVYRRFFHTWNASLDAGILRRVNSSFRLKALKFVHWVLNSPFSPFRLHCVAVINKGQA